MQNDFELTSYFYELPIELVAQRPLEPRDQCRLMVYDVQHDRLEHRLFSDLVSLLDPSWSLVLNRSSVYPARVFGKKESGGKIECLFLSLIEKQKCLNVKIRSNGRKHISDILSLGPNEERFIIDSRDVDGTFWIRPLDPHFKLTYFLSQMGTMPIPPYIRKGDSDQKDQKDY